LRPNSNKLEAKGYGTKASWESKGRRKEMPKNEVESQPDNADDADCDDMAMMSKGDISTARTRPKKQVGGRRAIDCEVSCDW
jgi:hypothetical protein